jgi:hypothetical protein
MTARKRLVFDLTHAAYFVHDLIPFGPQLYVVARKTGLPRGKWTRSVP